MPARDTERLLQSLREHLANGGRITAVTPLSIGHSSETYVVEGVDLILRMPPTEEPLFGPYYSGVAAQHAVLEELGSRSDAPPVPAVQELCEDESVLGAPFFLMDRVDGEAFERELPPWLTEADDDFRSAISRQWVDALCRTHNLGSLGSLGHELTTVDEWTRWRHLSELAESEDLVSIFDELIAEDPPASGPPAVVHGDCKMANILWSRGRINAFIDWEVAFNGDPLNDLGYALGFVPEGDDPGYPGYELPGMWSRAQIVDAWQEGTGRRAKAVELYHAAGIAKVASIVAYGVWLYESKRSADERFARWKPAVPLYVERVRRVLA
jgi:aminoglycoside phosphotransferase (APT) family kinase protein